MSDENLLVADVPEKFKDSKTGEVNMPEFAKSYRELEKQFAQRPTAPKTPEEYSIECSHGLFEIDGEVNKRLYDKGFTQDQAQEVYNLAAEKMVPIIAQMARDFEADRQVEKLISHFGGVEKWKSVSRQLLSFGRKSLPEEVLENMSGSYEGVLALHRLMMSEEPSLADDGYSADVTDTGDLQSMMRDPRYWRDRDPAYVQKVTDGFKTQYSS